MPDSPRIEELKRRVQSDPASIAFAALAEEYRRAERYVEAIDACKAGLVRHPSYLSAHVTLGRAFIEVGRLQDARQELEYVLKLAPENLAAIRGLAEIHRRMGEETGEAHTDVSMQPPEPPVAVSAPDARSNPSFDVRAALAEPASSPAALAAPPLLVTDRTETAAQRASDAAEPALETSADFPHVTYPRPVDPALAGLEEFLNAIIRARAERAAAR